MLVVDPEIMYEYKDKELTLEDEMCFENIHFKNCYIEEQRGDYIVFKDCILENVAFSDVNLKHLEFSNVRLKNCDLSNVNFEEPRFYRVEFVGCKLIGSYLPEGVLQYTLFKECIGQYLNLGFTQLKEVDFEACDLTDANLGECKLKKVTFNQCQMVRTDFSQTSLSGINLSTNEITGMKIQLTGFKNAKVSPMQAIEIAKMAGVKVIED